MKLLKMIALSTLAFSAAYGATLGPYNSSAAVNTSPANLLFAPPIPLFDPSLGTLTMVQIDFDAEVEGDFSFENQSDSDGTISGSATATFILIGPGALGNLVILNPAIAFSGPVAAMSTETFNDVSASDSDTYSSAVPAVLAAFTGIGNVAFSGSAAQTGSPVLNFSPGIYTQTASGSANLVVTYTYTTNGGPPNEIPEPATWAFLTGGGLMLLAFARFRSPQK